MKKSDALAKALQIALAEEAEREDKYGPEPGNGAIIKFNVRFSSGGTKYSYAAIRAGGLWYTTGPYSPKGYPWDELLDWLDDKYKVSGFKVVSR